MSWSSATGWNGRGWSRAAATPPASASFVAATDYAFTGSSGTKAWPTGTAAGDLVIVQIYEFSGTASTVTSAGGAWTALVPMQSWDPGGGANNNIGYFYRVVNSTDVAGSITFSGESFGGAGIYTFRGVTGASLAGTITTDVVPAYANNAASMTVKGFTPSGATLGAVVVHMTRNITTVSPNITGWTRDAADQATWTFGLMDMLDRFSGYAGGDVTLNLSADGNPHVACMFQLT